MCRWGASAVGLPGAGPAWKGIPALRAKAAIARPPSPTQWLPGVTTPASAAPTEAVDLRQDRVEGRPFRSRATRTGILS